MSDTPRMDQYVKMRASLAYCVDRDTSDFARQLERELAKVTNQRDLLIEGLEKLASCDWVITLPDRMDAVRNIANETLNKIKL